MPIDTSGRGAGLETINFGVRRSEILIFDLLTLKDANSQRSKSREVKDRFEGLAEAWFSTPLVEWLFIAHQHNSADARYCYSSSACLSRSAIVSKRLNVSACFFQHIVAQSF